MKKVKHHTPLRGVVSEREVRPEFAGHTLISSNIDIVLVVAGRVVARIILVNGRWMVIRQKQRRLLLRRIVPEREMKDLV